MNLANLLAPASRSPQQPQPGRVTAVNDASKLREIAAGLRQLRRSSPIAEQALPEWNEQSRRFAGRLTGDFSAVDLPEEVWHYLHDADLRIKDPDYKQTQDQTMDEIIADLERGIVPAPRGTVVSVHPRWLGAAGLVLVLLVLYWVAR